MSRPPIRILLQTTIPATADDWSIWRFSHLGAFLTSQYDDDGAPLFEVTQRDRAAPGTEDPVLSRLDQSDFDEMWLFAVDTGQGVSATECAAITRFRERGRGLLVTRDHMDLGSSICTLGGVGEAHHFHTRNLDPDESLREIDDPYTTSIFWPNFHSGANGDYQHIEVVAPLHPVLEHPGAPDGAIRYLPSHPHEGGVGAPDKQAARVIARGRSKVTGRPFNIAVAFEAHDGAGRAIAQSTFHHFVDYNWDIAACKPSFVTEAPGDAMRVHPDALADTHRYVRNAALWLSGRTTSSRARF